MDREYKKLIAGQKADELAMNIHAKTGAFSREEVYGLTRKLEKQDSST